MVVLITIWEESLSVFRKKWLNIIMNEIFPQHDPFDNILSSSNVITPLRLLLIRINIK